VSTFFQTNIYDDDMMMMDPQHVNSKWASSAGSKTL